MPREFVLLRFEKWEKVDFGPTKSAFVEKFDDLLIEQDKDDLEFLSALRNAIGHSHVSIGRDYFLYRPRTRKETEVIQGLALDSRADAMDPPVIKLAFYDDEYYLECFNRIKRLDEGCLETIAGSVGVTHSRIR